MPLQGPTNFREEMVHRILAAMESFCSLLQKNVRKRKQWATREELRIAIVVWIERTYHHHRQRTLGELTPIEYEMILYRAANAA